MARNLKPRIEEFLSDYPYGAPLWQLANYLGSSTDTTIQALRRMSERSEAVMTLCAEMYANTVWSLPAVKNALPIFKAMETLLAMQAVAYRQSDKFLELEAA